MYYIGYLLFIEHEIKREKDIKMYFVDILVQFSLIVAYCFY